MMWLMLWLLLGGTSGYLASRIDRRLGPATDRRTRKMDDAFMMAVGVIGGPLATALLPCFAHSASWRRRMVEGPNAKDSLRKSLALREEIKSQMREIDKEMETIQALLGGVIALFDDDFSEEASEQVGIRPDSMDMPTTAEIETACREWLELKCQREAYEHGLSMTERHIDSLRMDYESRLESYETPIDLLRPNRSLLEQRHALSIEPRQRPDSPPPREEQETGPEIDPVRLQAKMGRLSPSVAVRLIRASEHPLVIRKGSVQSRCYSLIHLTDTSDSAFHQHIFRRGGRGVTADWILMQFGDHRLALAVAAAETPQEMTELIRLRLQQANEILAAF